MADQTGERNPNWKGGRSLASHGYVLIRVGVGHHLADVRGYAYEHRLVAEKSLGRRLLPAEEVHHDDDSKANNEPGNLIVKGSRAEHRLAHRKPGSLLRPPGAANPSVPCDCGCGSVFQLYDASGRPRRYMNGHNVRRGASGKWEALP